MRAPEDVCDGLTANPPADHLREPLRGLGLERALGIRMKRGPIGAEHRGEHHLGVEPRRVRARRLELLDGLSERVAQL